MTTTRSTRIEYRTCHLCEATCGLELHLDGGSITLVRGDREGNLIKIKNYLGAEWLEMLPDSRFENETGGPVGYCGPVGTKAKRVLADVALKGRANWVIGGNKADTHLGGANPGRDFPKPDYGDFTTVFAGDPCPRCSTPLEIYRGIEVGHVFKLGTKYSDSMSCTYLDEKGERRSMIMGCYGLGIGRTVAAAVEQSHDDDGIIWPMPIAPFQVVVTQLGKEENVRAAAEDVYRRLANLIDKILKGANPGDIPFYQPTKFELNINLKTAKALGLTIPRAFLQRVDSVLE